ncbi:amino acid ABC transporter permease [soil metagenome]
MWSDFLYIIRGLPWTLALMFGSLFIGAVLGLPLMMAGQSRFLPVRLLVIVLFSIVRAVPQIVWIFIIFFGIGTALLPMSPFAACLIGFGAIAAVNMAEIYRGGLISIHHGQVEAAKALNLSRWHTFHDVVWPQMFRVALPASATYAIGLFKDTAIASTIGVPEILYLATRLSQTTYRGLAVFGMVGLIYILISLPVAMLTRIVDRKIRAKVAR